MQNPSSTNFHDVASASANTEITKIKVFGERNTGTNFLERFLSENFPTLTILPDGPERNVKASVTGFPHRVRYFARQRLSDALCRSDFDNSFGWKHARVTPEYLRSAVSYETTFFCFIVRNPFAYLNSLYRRPYNLVPRRPWWQGKSKFLRSPLVANGRDNLDDPLISNPVKLWAMKTRSYLLTSRALARAQLIRYEDLVADPERALDQISAFGLRRGKALIIPQQSTKSDTLSFEQYRRLAADFDPAHYFKPDDIDFIRSEIDAELCRELDYSLG